MKGTMQFSVSFIPTIEELNELRKKNLLLPQQQMVRGPTKTLSIYFEDKEEVEVPVFCENVHNKIRSLVRDCEKQFKIY